MYKATTYYIDILRRFLIKNEAGIIQSYYYIDILCRFLNKNEATRYYIDILLRFVRTKQQDTVYGSKRETVLCSLRRIVNSRFCIGLS